MEMGVHPLLSPPTLFAENAKQLFIHIQKN